MIQNIIFITAFKNINREKWQFFKRSDDEYLADFLNLIKNIEYKLVVYIEEDMKKKMRNIKFKENIIIKNLDNVNTFYNKYLEKDTNIIKSKEYLNKIPENRKKCPEHCQIGYNLITNSKINFVLDVKNIYPNYKFYSWIDFGTFNKQISNIPKNINIKLIKEKITYSCLKFIPENKISPEIMLTKNDIYFKGGAFIVYNELVELFHKLWENKIIEFHNKNITDDDQNILLQIYFDNPKLFDILYSNNWSSLFRENFNNM